MFCFGREVDFWVSPTLDKQQRKKKNEGVVWNF